MKKVNKEFMSAAEIKEQRLNLLYKILPIISILLLIALWLAASRGSANFPSPQDVLNRTIRLFTHPVKKKNLILHVLASLRRIGLALLFDWTFGIIFGIILGWFPKARAFFSPIFDAFRAVPPLAWIPLITLCAVDKMYLDVGTVFNATPAQRLLKIAIPSSLDAIFAGVRTSTSAAWMVVLAAEMLGAGDAGVGFLISRGMDSMDMPLVLTGMIAIGIVGALLAILTQIAERLICPWTRKTK